MNMDAQTIAQLVIKSRLSHEISEDLDFRKAGEELAAEIMAAVNAKRESVRASVIAEHR